MLEIALTWHDLGESNARGAALLSRDSVASRASVSRAYYAVYHEITHQLVGQGQTTFGKFRDGRDRKNPPHEKVARFAENDLKALNQFQRKELGRLARRLRIRREDADYRPGMAVDSRAAHEALRDMSAARLLLGVI